MPTKAVRRRDFPEMKQEMPKEKQVDNSRLYLIGFVGAGALFVLAPVVFPALWFVSLILRFGAIVAAIFTLYLFAVTEWPELKDLF